MQQCLQLSSRARVIGNYRFRMFRDNAGKEMVLIGESTDRQAVLLRVSCHRRPVDVSGDVAIADEIKWYLDS